MSKRILIVGGGIGGLCAAIGLQRAGFEVVVFEQAPVFGEVGAGITIGLPAGRALDFLGIGDTVRAASDVPTAPAIGHYKTGELIAGFKKEQVKTDLSLSFHQIHRADLHKILSDTVAAADPKAIHLGREFLRAEQDEQGVTAIFADGSKIHGDALVGCDGLRSAVRTSLFGDTPPRFTGQVAYRFLTPYEKIKDFLHLGESAHYMGPGRNWVRYLIRNRTMLNNVAFVTTDSWKEEGWSIKSSREELLRHFDGWTEDVIGLIRNAPPDGIYKWALFDREPLPVWSDRVVSLLGDAAHPMLPFLGLGAAMAMEDSVLLARALTETDDIAAGFKRYADARKGRTAEILIASRKQGVIYNTVDPDDYHKTADKPAGNMETYRYDPALQPLPAA